MTAFVSNPPLTAEYGEKFLRRLVDQVGMKILMDASAIYCEDLGNEGVTGTVGLTTSHASFHSWHTLPDQAPFMNFDLYSCRDFSASEVVSFLHRHFDCSQVDYTLFDRAPGAKNKILEEATIYFNSAVGTDEAADDSLTPQDYIAKLAS